MTPEQRRSYSQALKPTQWTNIPPAITGRQIAGSSGATGLGIVGLGKYKMPDGSHQVSFGLAQPALDAYRSMRYGLGFEQDPNAPEGYVSEGAISRGAFGLSGAAATGGITSTAAARAIGSPIMPKGAIGSNSFMKFDKSSFGAYSKSNLLEIANSLGANTSVARSRAQLIDAIERRRTEVIRSAGKNAEATHDTMWTTDSFVPRDIDASQSSAAAQFDEKLKSIFESITPNKSARLNRDTRGTTRARYNDDLANQVRNLPKSKLKDIADYFDAPIGRTRAETVNNIFDGDFTPQEITEALKYVAGK